VLGLRHCKSAALPTGQRRSRQHLRSWFQHGLVVEVPHQNAEKHSVKMSISIEHDLDYKRGGFTPV